MKLLTKQNIAQLRANAKAKKPIAYVKLFNPAGRETWYLSELDENNIAYGVADVFEKELGYTSLDELSELKLPFGLTIERDLYFNPTPLDEVA